MSIKLKRIKKELDRVSLKRYDRGSMRLPKITFCSKKKPFSGHLENCHVRLSGARSNSYLTVTEQNILVRHNEYALKAFCKSFTPPMPPSVMAIALIYLKRIYLRYSAMDYNPRDLIQFVGNLKKDRERASSQILWFELTLMQILDFQLTVHTAYRPLEGLFINLKTHMPDVDVQGLRPATEYFLDKALFSNVYLLYSPAQIAMAALIYSADIASINIKYFLTEHLMRGAGPGQVDGVLRKSSEIESFVLMAAEPSKSEVKVIYKKLETCRNQDLNPHSEVFQKRIRELDEDDDQTQLDMYQRNSQEQSLMEESIMTE